MGANTSTLLRPETLSELGKQLIFIIMPQRCGGQLKSTLYILPLLIGPKRMCLHTRKLSHGDRDSARSKDIEQ